ncbi:MAG: M20/M25/M40 family metallo-hydrolase [Armatimonadetes bacterium]|nr:M20/M25/M40 family metallo-hydrolase [Armatimonadota bacterium]
MNHWTRRYRLTSAIGCTLLLGAGIAFAETTLTRAAPAKQGQMLTVDMMIVSQEREKSEVVNNLEYLSDMIGPRLTGSQRLLDANRWTAEKMKEYGLQNVTLEPYTIPQGWERNRCEAHIVSPVNVKLHVDQGAWTPGTRGKVKGTVVIFAPRNEADLEAMKGKLKGAIVVDTPPANNFMRGGVLPGGTPPPPIPAFEKSPLTQLPKTAERVLSGMEMEDDQQPPPTRRNGVGGFMAFRRKLSEFMQKEGVIATLRVSEKPQDLQNMTGSWSAQSKIPVLFITQEHIALIYRLMKRNLPVEIEVNAGGRFTKGPITVYNTVGEIPGTDKANEIVLLGAHLDSWDLGQGSTDNGTGSCVVLETARLFHALNLKPRRTVRFVLFSGEEQGLYGSAAYVESHKAEMSRFSVVFVHDTGTGRVKGAWLQGRSEVQPLLEKEFDNLQALGLLTEKAKFFPGKMNGTDHAPFDDAGVPAFAFYQDSAEYSLTHHSQSDTFDKVRPNDLKQGACVMAILAYNASTRDEAYPRKK